MKVFSVFIPFCFFSLFSCKSQLVETEESNSNEMGRQVYHLDDKTLKLFQDSKGNYWFAGNGLIKYDGEKLIHYSKQDGLADNRIIAFQEDHLGNVYFDTLEGVNKYDGEKFTTLEVKEGGEWKLEENDLWFSMGWEGKGPYRYDGEYLYALEFPVCEQEEIFFQVEREHFNNPRAIYNIYKDKSGHIWFGTAALGACRYDGNKIAWIYEDEMNFTPGGGVLGIRASLEDSLGNYWFTNARYSFSFEDKTEERKGAYYLQYEKLKGPAIYEDSHEIKDPYYMSIVEDTQGDLWMVTYSDGVWRKKGNELIHYPVEHNGSEVLLFSIFQDNEETLWLGTHNAGAMKFNGSSFEKFEP